MRERFEARLEAHRLVAILRGVPDDHVGTLARALVEGGVRLLEVAGGDAHALAQVARLRAALPRDVGVGAGTVTDRDRAEGARDAGAEFLVTPHVSEAVNAFAARHDLGLVCGAFTPTEIHTARAQGSRFVKLFPASLLGPAYVEALLGPYPDAELIAVGGVDEGNLGAFLSAGARGAAVGSRLTRLDWDAPDFEATVSLAARLSEAARA